MPQLDISIILVNWNQKELTVNCLESIYNNPPSCSYGIVLVDNASQDGSVGVIKEKFPQVKIIENRKNVGLVKANNAGMKTSDSEFIILMNNDTIIKPHCFDNLYHFIETHRDAGIVGAKMYYGDGTLQMSCFQFPTILNAIYETLGLTSLFPKSRIFGSYEIAWWDHMEPRQVDWVSTACYIARRAAFEQVGYIDNTYFVYSEDIDMGFKMKNSNYKVYYLPSAELVHLSGRNVGAVSHRKIMEVTASLRYTMKKNHYYLYYRMWNLIKTVGVIFKIVKWKLIAFSTDRKRSKMATRNAEQFIVFLKYFILPLRKIHFSTLSQD